LANAQAPQKHEFKYQKQRILAEYGSMIVREKENAWHRADMARAIHGCNL
jgi:hypothetical protein